MRYDETSIEETRLTDIDQLQELSRTQQRIWLDIDGLGDPAWIEKTGTLLQLHPLALEDCVHVRQRAKVEDYGRRLFIVSRMSSYDEHFQTEQLSIFVSNHYVVTVQEGKPGTAFSRFANGSDHPKAYCDNVAPIIWLMLCWMQSLMNTFPTSKPSGIGL